MEKQTDLSLILRAVVETVKAQFPGKLVALQVDVFVDTPTFKKLVDANPINISRGDEPVLAEEKGNHRLQVFLEEELDDEAED